MLRRLAWPFLAAALATAPAHAAESGASCGEVLVYEGQLLEPRPVEDPARLPAIVGADRALLPECGQGVGDKTDVLRFENVPPQVALLDRSRRTLFLAPGSPIAASGHPLQGVTEPLRRREGPCRRDPAPRTVTADETFAGRVLRGAGGRFTVDAATRISGRPVYTPIRGGQRLQVRTLTCGARKVADRITFDGPLPRDERVEVVLGGGDESSSPPWLIPAIILGASLLLIVVVGIGLLWPRGRPRRPG